MLNLLLNVSTKFGVICVRRVTVSQIQRFHHVFHKISSSECAINPFRRNKNIFFASYSLNGTDSKGIGVSDAVNYLKDLRDNPRLSNSRRLALVDELWNKLENSLMVLNEDLFILKLECYKKSRKPVVPKLFFKELEAAGLEKTERLLKVLLSVVAEHGDPGYVSSVITSMKSRNYVVDETVFSSLITAYGVTKDNKNVRFVLNSMQECGMAPGALTYTSLMRAAGIAGDYSALHTTRMQAEEKGVQFSDENILSVLDTLARYNRGHLITTMKPLTSCCSADQLVNLATTLIYSGFSSGAYSLLKLIENKDLSNRCKIFIQEMLSASASLKQLMDVAGKMVEEETYIRAYYDILYKKLVESKVDDSIAVLKACKEAGQTIRPHFFFPLVISSHRQSGEQGIWEILKLMREVEIKPDAETLTDFVLPRLTIDEDGAVLKRLQQVSAVPISSLIVPYLSHLFTSGRLKQATKIYQRYEKSVPDNGMSDLMSLLVAGYIMTRDHQTAAELIKLFKIHNVGNWLLMVFSSGKWLPLGEYVPLFQELSKVGCWITPQEEKWLLRIFLRNGAAPEDVKSALKKLVNEDGQQSTPLFIPHPEEMSTTELENHVIELEKKGGNTRGVLRKLLQEACRKGNAKEAQKAYEKLINMGAELSPGILSSIFHVYVQCGMLDEAAQTLQKIETTYPQFRMDHFKILDLATLLVKNNQYSDAVDLINKNAQRTRRNLESIERNCWELLCATAEGENGASKVKQMFKTLLVNNFCKGTNVTLGPLIVTLLKRGNLDAAVEEFCAISREFKKTPSQLDVMLAAVSAKNENFIANVTEAITFVHGANSAQAVFLTALALSRDLDRVLSQIKVNKINLKNEKLQNQIERMSSLGQIEGLRLLFTAFWEEQDGNLNFIIDRILQAYHRTGDADGALQFWTDLQEKEVSLNEAQRSSLAGLVASTTKGQN